MMRWIVVEWNQASGQPSIAGDGELFWSESEAESFAEQLRAETRVSGRRERHTVHEIDLDVTA
ncbi:hypothetical protein [Microbacterium algeriense]|uniref:hypothetical protein n=1 Tax=Microbacterium algeriense TaxID=2615184 RepID=UPI0022E5915C|nr:hypothetical protein [Microbacterium algeriense]